MSDNCANDYHGVTAHIICRGAANAIAFYKRAFGATEKLVMPGPGGTVMHAELKIAGGSIMLAEENPQWGSLSPLSLKGTPVVLHFYVADVDAALAQAVAAGATLKMPATDMFWGDRYGQVTDPFGHLWSIATHKEDVTPEEMQKRMAKMFSEGGCGGEKK